MSHFAERKEKDCLNCGTEVQGRYCHKCGQENVEPKETFWHLITHFTYDITHFDGKFFSSVKYLLFRPGFLSKEYIRGKRASYLNPIKMYVFISAFFFLYFFAVSGEKLKVFDDGEKRTVAKVTSKINNKINDLQDDLKDPTATPEEKSSATKRIDSLKKDLVLLAQDSSNINSLYYYKSRKFSMTFKNRSYRDYKQYDSIQKALPEPERDGFVNRQFAKKAFEVAAEAREGNYSLLREFISKFLHTIPQLLFISLPLFALVLKLLYRRKKNFYYVDHAIFTVHLYCAYFMMIFFLMLVTAAEGSKYFDWLSYLQLPLLIALYYYQYKAMRTFYGQSRKKTILKQIIQNLLATFVMLLLATLFFFISAIFI